MPLQALNEFTLKSTSPCNTVYDLPTNKLLVRIGTTRFRSLSSHLRIISLSGQLLIFYSEITLQAFKHFIT